jgi:hypothetical protein
MLGASFAFAGIFRLRMRAMCPGDPGRPFDDSDYHAAWIGEEGEGEKPNHTDGETYDGDEGSEEDGDHDEKSVTLVRVQWWERAPAYMVVDPFNPSRCIPPRGRQNLRYFHRPHHRVRRADKRHE